MRRRSTPVSSGYKIVTVDDESGIIDTLSVILRRSGYNFTGITDPVAAIERVRNEHFDLLILDYLMEPVHGDKVVEKIREFDSDIYILLLTGHKDLAPPLETIRELEIQGYCEKSDKFEPLLLMIESGIKSISQMRTIKKFKDGLNRILQAVPKIYQLQPIGNILEEILVEILPLVNSKNAFILVDDFTLGADENKSIFRGIGRYGVDIEELMPLLSPSLIEDIGYARMTNHTVITEKGAVFPLINEYLQSIGVLYIESTELDEGIKLFEIYASQAASSLNNAFLHSLVNIKNDELRKTYNELKMSYMDTVQALRMAVDAKDVYTRGHSDRVAYYAVKIGRAFGLPAGDLEILRIGGIFHDIGKIGTADDILLKTQKLNYSEYDIIKKHPLKGAHILSAVSMFKDVVPLVKFHHERMDGKGYPQGLKGDEIPFLARILSVADAYDAMTSDRQYRARLDPAQARQQLIDGAGTQFDRSVVDTFIDLLECQAQRVGEVACGYDENLLKL